MSNTTPPKWKQDLQKWLMLNASRMDDLADAGIRRLRRRFGRQGVPQLQTYMGYASRDAIHLHGRVLTNPAIEPNFDDDRWWHNLVGTMRRFASDEVPGITVEASVEGVTATSISDSEGYFRITLPLHASMRVSGFWSQARLHMIDAPGVNREQDQAFCNFLNTPENASYAIISDVDDTILHTGATDIATMAKLTFFGNARTRAPLDGVAELYERMQQDGGTDGVLKNPIFYISSSPWNLYDLLEDFLDLNAIPRGPLLLRDLGIDEHKFIKSTHDHKIDKLNQLLDHLDGLSFILLGDSGQEDARLYATAARHAPDRIKAIFIRDIDPSVQSHHDTKVDQYVRQAAEVDVPMYLVKDSVDVADRLIREELLTEAAYDRIVRATDRDRHRQRTPVQP
ncbi:DUF2183 domain-containing protein [Roseiconus nitratireducens]|uniref:DUF2183 domain-containing protein n=1 Tax=Roseiconus nitratireducens TaxID=2605748 RepID=A0A5M6DDF6_9BACT|nr:phosphatase domain-containing protein [Roseiconus nitratireducens]KAA5544496.1 DUF2183 domain-containing protein [Roseiconus nitratireducens]